MDAEELTLTEVRVHQNSLDPIDARILQPLFQSGAKKGVDPVSNSVFLPPTKSRALFSPPELGRKLCL